MEANQNLRDEVRKRLWKGLMLIRKGLPDRFSKETLEECLRITDAQVQKTAQTGGAFHSGPIVEKLASVGLTYALSTPFSNSLIGTLGVFRKAEPRIWRLANMRDIMGRFHVALLEGFSLLDADAWKKRERDMSADLILWVYVILDSLDLKSARDIYRAYDLAAWRKLNRKKPHIPIPEHDVRRIVSFTSYCQHVLTQLRATGELDRRWVRDILDLYQAGVVPVACIDDICDHLPRWPGSTDPVNVLMQMHGMSDERADAAPQASSPVGTPWTQDRSYDDDGVADQITNEDMGEFYDKLRAESRAPSVPQARRKKIERALADIDRAIRNERATLLDELRRQYGGDITSSSIDGHRFLLRNRGSVAMWLRVSPDGSENASRPHVSISLRNGPGFHITKGRGPKASHFYFDEGGRFMYGTQRSDGRYSRVQAVPQDVAALAARTTTFLGGRRRR